MKRHQNGMTLVELIITLVIIGIAAAALFSAMATITARSADPMLRQQSLAIAEGYLERLQSRSYSELNDVSQQPPRGLDGELIDELSTYQVEVRVSSSQLGPSSAQVEAKQLAVIVTDPQGEEITLSGWRTCYGEASCP
ncbi:prepilin-type N-terminal cleavage/methylation domain-containing protein [Pseudomonas sp.]|uniref:type IV pilus modification PilV family protein n=1 Tax=Pseudomonas sp. TaxID=306 RepID=UPI0019D8672A|nr:prepilin-type N-terminal cleavage/methylation domain-containing protein [Pseudomonas sp.]MBF0674040.1 prepilin-type N-terminal cleavage/methylation domain-containing protein [Pseudomonas sp.]